MVGGRRTDGLVHLEWYETQPGVRWLPEWMSARLGPHVRAVVVDARNRSRSWTGGRPAGVRPTLAGHRDVAAAAGLLYDGIADDHIRHRGQVELARGVLDAKRRPMVGGQAFGWDRKAPGSSALLAASLALWGVDTPSVARPRRRRPGAPSTRRVVVM